MNPLFFTLTAVAGLILGSFFTVLVHRLPNGRSIVSPGSHCPHCHTPIPWLNNIPVLSYFLLRGKCSICFSRISPMYPLVELVTAAVLLFFAWVAGLFEGGRVHREQIGTAILAATMVPVIVIDFRHRIIPDEITIGLIIIGFACSFFPGGIGALSSGAGILAGGGILYLTALLGQLLFRKEGMGGGDIKLLAGIGAFVGAWPLVAVLLFGSLSALAAVAWKGPPFRGREIPFGPFLALGLWATLLMMFRTGWLAL